MGRNSGCDQFLGKPLHGQVWAEDAMEIGISRRVMGALGRNKNLRKDTKG